MQVLLESLARQQLINIYYYNFQFSFKNAIETNRLILEKIYSLKHFPYIGRYIQEAPNHSFREIIYRRSKHSCYRIAYYISENNDTIYIFNISNSKQNLKYFLIFNNYFQNYFEF